MTVDSLHASFQRIEAKVKHMIEKGCTNHSLEECIRRLWSQQFHQDLSRAATAGMIMHYRALYKTRKTRKQKGGMAPLEYVGGQGADVVYGSFPVFEGSSPAFVRSLGGVEGQRTVESSIGTSCTKQQGGRRSRSQRGGSIYSSVAMGHPLVSVPANVFQTTTNAVQGRPSFVSGDPTKHTWSSSQFAPKAFDANAQSTFQLSPVYTAY